MRDADVVIAGGGMAGLTLALALMQAGLSVIVADAEPPKAQLAETYDGRAFAIAYASYRMWKALGLGPDLDPHAQRIERILCTDGRVGEAPSILSLAFDRRELDPRPNGEALGVMLENRRLRAALHKAAEETRLDVRAPVRVEGYEADDAGVTVRLSDGTKLRAGLVVGAEGRRSTIRETAKIRTVGWSYNQTALVCTVAHELPHEGVAHEYFLPSGPFAILPLVQDRANIVWVERPRTAEAIKKLPDDAYMAELALRFGGHLGALRLAGPRFAYPLSLQIAERFIAPRMALVGDSAHGVHPIAGQGLNVGLRDVAALAECLADGAALGLDVGDAEILKRYQRWRRFDVMALALVMDGFNRVFSNDLPILRTWRARGMALVDALPFARKLFMAEAAGGAGDLPRLLRGEALA